MKPTGLIALAVLMCGCLAGPDDDPAFVPLEIRSDRAMAAEDVRVAEAARRPDETDWMSGHYGVGFHYLQNGMRETKNGGSAEWNAAVESFDVNRFADDVAATGAKWVLFTVGQSSGYYCSPNSVLDQHSGYRPGERNSTRDLPMAMAEALANKGIKLILYVPANAPKKDERIANGFGLTRKNSNGNWAITEAFTRKWAEVIEEWSRRYGTKVAGWWFDGFYGSNGFKPAFVKTYVEAARAGNPDAMVALNPGASAGLRQVAPEQSYTAGETGNLTRVECDDRLVGSAQCAIFVPLGNWGGGRVKYTDNQIVAYTNRQLDVGGAVTWALGVSANGKVVADMRKVFQRIRPRLHAGVEEVWGAEDDAFWADEAEAAAAEER